MSVTVQCATCEKKFLVRPSRRNRTKFCSRECIPSRSPRIKVSCKKCGKNMLVTKSRLEKGEGKFCSKTCLYQQKKSTRLECACKKCGEKFFVVPSKIKNGLGVYCSKECEVSYRRENAKENLRISCAECGKEFYVRPSVREKGYGKFCSRACDTSNRHKRRITCKCQYCNVEFNMPPSRNQKFCSKQCKVKSNTKRVNKYCKVCNKMFETPLSEIRKGGGKYCSVSCYRSIISGEGNPNYKGRVPRFCLQCNAYFTVEPHVIENDNITSNGNYCSKECSWKSKYRQVECTCEKCGKSFTTNYSEKRRGGGKYCSPLCAGNDYSQVERNCLKCGNIFMVRRHELNNRKFCSNECYYEHHQNGDEIGCEKCGKKFYINRYRSDTKGARFCSVDCVRNGQELSCVMCYKKFYVNPYRVNSARFCSKQCLHKYNGPSSLEIAIEDELNKLGLVYEKERKFGRYYADFFIPHLDLIIECDGTQHLTIESIKKKDKRRDKWFKERGYTTIRLPEHEIRKDPEAALLSKLPSLQGSLF